MVGKSNAHNSPMDSHDDESAASVEGLEIGKQEVYDGIDDDEKYVFEDDDDIASFE